MIVQQLELHDRETVLERWLAHHLAEVIAEADRAVGPAKAAYEAQAVDLVLKLWVHRRALPEPVDPLGGYRKAVEVLGRLAPDTSPWAYYRGSDTYDSLLREMFELLSGIVVAGILLTQVSRARPVTEEELKALEEEERYWHSTLDQWMPFVTRSSSRPEIEIEFVNTDMTDRAQADRESERVGDSSEQDHTSEEEVERDDASLHAAIVSNLKRMQTDLSDLLTRWQESLPREVEGDGENSGGGMGGYTATTDCSPNTFRDGEESRENIEAETTGKEVAPSDLTPSFWSSLSLTELAKAQGVSPVDDLEGIAALWPSDDDPDEFLDHVLLERAARRRGVGSGSG